jgi:hypothetical protein
LKICNDNRDNNGKYGLNHKRLEILKKLGRTTELNQSLLSLLEKTGEYVYFLRLKQETPLKEWNTYLTHIITDASQKQRYSLLSRIYQAEMEYTKAYDYSQHIDDLDYLENLANKLRMNHPKQACELLRRLCFEWIDNGSGWPYKKAGKMLKIIKRIDKQGTYFQQTKKDIINKHKKKYSLMNIIKNI